MLPLSNMLLSHRTNVLLDTELYGILREQSKKTGKSVGQIIRESVAKRYGRKVKKKTNLLALKKIREYVKKEKLNMSLAEILKYRDEGRK